MKLNLLVATNSDIQGISKFFSQFFNITHLKERMFPKSLNDWKELYEKYDIVILDNMINFENTLIKKFNNINSVLYFFNEDRNKNNEGYENRKFKTLGGCFSHIINQWMEGD